MLKKIVFFETCKCFIDWLDLSSKEIKSSLFLIKIIFKEGNLWYPSPQTRGLDASIFTQIFQEYGYCYPTFIYGQYKGAFSDQLGNRWIDTQNEFL